MIRALLALLVFGLFSAAGLAARGETPSVLNLGTLPPTSEQGREAYGRFVLGNANRAFAFGSQGAYGGVWGARTIEAARDGALASCKQKGAADCQLYADNLSVVWPGRVWAPAAKPPSALVEGSGFRFVPDERFLWFPASVARGLIVWGHGYGGDDERGVQPPSFLRALNNDGYSVVRFDREPGEDIWRDRQTRHLRESLTALRAVGWKHIVAGGQSRGGWNALDLLRTPGVADVIVVASAGPGTGTDATTQIMHGQTLLYSLVDDAPPQTTRVAYIQFADDPYGGDKAQRAQRMRDILQPKIGALLMIDRPEGFSGHGAAYLTTFGSRYGQCLRRFVEGNTPMPGC